MKLNIYTILDSATGAYMRPFFFQSDGQATRSFGDIAKDPEHDIGKHPEDYSLHRIGTFDDQKAKIQLEDRECIATALELLDYHNKKSRAQTNTENLQNFEHIQDITSAGGTA